MEIVSDAQGNIWVTSFSAGLLLRLDPRTGTFTPYYAPFTGPGTGGLYGLIVTPTGEIWVTVLAENVVARLDVVAHRFIYYAIPTPGSEPLGIAAFAAVGENHDDRPARQRAPPGRDSLHRCRRGRLLGLGGGRVAAQDGFVALGIDLSQHDVRFVEDDWESPTLGASGLGWEVWLDGMEVSQFTYFQQVGGIECDPVSTELTYGLERLAMYVQGVDRVFDLDFNGAGVTYGDVFLRNEQEYSAHGFEHADVPLLTRQFRDAEIECTRLTARELALPAYDQCIKASHLFNLLDASGAISVTERAAYIGRVRALARGCCEAWLAGESPAAQFGDGQPAANPALT